MTPAGMLELAPVEQIDRDAAADLVAARDLMSREFIDDIREGHRDNLKDVQALARHRIAGQAELREAVVRECAEIANEAYRSYREPTDWDYGAQDACARIERTILAALRSSIVSNRGGDNG